MNEKLPKPMLDALAREAAPAEHPAADVLAAFVEQALAEGETGAIAAHLAQCGECREAVFLASSAAEDAVAKREELLVAAHVSRELRPAYHAAARATAASPARIEKPRRRWMPRLLWAAPIAAVLAVAGYFTREYFAPKATAPELASSMSREAPVQPRQPQQEIARMQPPSDVVAAQPSPKAGAPTKAAKASKPSVETYDVVAIKSAPPAAAEDNATPAKTKTEEAKAAPESAAIAIGGAATAAPPAPKANGFAPSANEALRQYGPADSLSLSVSRAVKAAHPGWRVTEQGHLEHLTPDGWTRVLADHASVFRVVAVVGSEVWAGGIGGALFHSSDGGQKWKKVSIAADGTVETGTIVSLRFADPQHGVATIDSGSSYVTNDGGVSWSRQ